MYLVVIQSVFTAVSGSRLRWQRMERYGSLPSPAGVEPPYVRPADGRYDHDGLGQPAGYETPGW
ncbi:hypothetical protein [Streptomyces sp. NPDC057616]|uniref:hypothetical protein n=1 Tax=Streptomyces sp. NPDC057616 TaxID=3346183 RepID=UPI003693C57B